MSVGRHGTPQDPGDEPTEYINVGDYGTAGPSEPPASPWYLKPAALIVWGLLVSLLIGVIVYGVVVLVTSRSGVSGPTRDTTTTSVPAIAPVTPTPPTTTVRTPSTTTSTPAETTTTTTTTATTATSETTTATTATTASTPETESTPVEEPGAGSESEEFPAGPPPGPVEEPAPPAAPPGA